MGYDNEMKGVLFMNDNKTTESHPDYRGSCEIEGIEYWISSWVNEAKQTGAMYQSLKFQIKEEQGKKQETIKPNLVGKVQVTGDPVKAGIPADHPYKNQDGTTKNVKLADDFDDDIPF